MGLSIFEETFGNSRVRFGTVSKRDAQVEHLAAITHSVQAVVDTFRDSNGTRYVVSLSENTEAYTQPDTKRIVVSYKPIFDKGLKVSTACTVMLGLTLHEIGHTLYTFPNMPEFERAFGKAGEFKRGPETAWRNVKQWDQLAYTVLNIGDDARLEALMSSALPVARDVFPTMLHWVALSVGMVGERLRWKGKSMSMADRVNFMGRAVRYPWTATWSSDTVTREERAWWIEWGRQYKALADGDAAGIVALTKTALDRLRNADEVEDNDEPEPGNEPDEDERDEDEPQPPDEDGGDEPGPGPSRQPGVEDEDEDEPEPQKGKGKDPFGDDFDKDESEDDDEDGDEPDSDEADDEDDDGDDWDDDDEDGEDSDEDEDGDGEGNPTDDDESEDEDEDAFDDDDSDDGDEADDDDEGGDEPGPHGLDSDDDEDAESESDEDEDGEGKDGDSDKAGDEVGNDEDDEDEERERTFPDDFDAHDLKGNVDAVNRPHGWKDTNDGALLQKQLDREAVTDRVKTSEWGSVTVEVRSIAQLAAQHREYLARRASRGY